MNSFGKESRLSSSVALSIKQLAIRNLRRASSPLLWDFPKIYIFEFENGVALSFSLSHQVAIVFLLISLY